MKILLSVISLILTVILLLAGISTDGSHAQDDPAPTPEASISPVNEDQDEHPTIRLEYSRDILILENIGSEIIQYDNLTFQGDIAGYFETTTWTLNFGNELASGECIQLVANLSAYTQPNCSLIGWVRYTQPDLFWSAFSGNATFVIDDGDRNIAICEAFIGEAQVCEIDLSVGQSSDNDMIINETTNVSPYDIAIQGVSSNDEWTPLTETFAGVEMVLVPSGCFMMGSDDLEHEVCFNEPFWIDKYEVTNASYGSFSSGLDSFDGNCAEYSFRNNQPRNCVTWFEARDYCQRRNARLPNEAEWEYATRGPDSLIYPWGNESIENVKSIENVIGNPSLIISEAYDIGSFPLGISWVEASDIVGNLAEWTTTMESSYPYNSNDGRNNLDDLESKRIFRGIEQSSTTRAVIRPDQRYYILGFRCAMDFDGSINTAEGENMTSDSESNVTSDITDTPAPPSDPLELAQQGVSRNTEWIPYIETFGGMEVVLVPAGCFMMGSENGDSNASPIHEVCIDEPFWISKSEVSCEQISSVCNNTEQNNSFSVDFYSASAMCQEQGGRLPTEAEWEYAARGPDNLTYTWGNAWDETLFNSTDSISWTGASDMNGGMREWVFTIFGIRDEDNSNWSEIYTYPYNQNDGRETVNYDTQAWRVVRGVSLSNVSERTAMLSYRDFHTTDYEVEILDIGFRCVYDFDD